MDDASELKPGMRINLNAQMEVESANAREFFAPHKIPAGVMGTAKNKDGMLTDIYELHEIASVDGNQVRFGEPIHLDPAYYENIAIYRITKTLEECGIEDLSLSGNFLMQYKPHGGSRYGEDFRMIDFNRVYNSWVRRVRISDFSSSISARLCGLNTFSDILLEGNSGKRPITINNSYGTLCAFVREYTGSHNGLGVGDSAAGTVFYRCGQQRSVGANGNHPRATLYDLNEGRPAAARFNAKGLPAHDKGLTIWNWKATAPGQFDFWPAESQHTRFLPPVIAGLHGETFEIHDIETDLLAFESPGKKTEPESLFEAQLEQRLGRLPVWLAETRDAFEAGSRHAGAAITSPANHSEHRQRSLQINLKWHGKVDTELIENITLYASNTSLWEGFKPVGNVDPETMTITFKVPEAGVWALKVRVLNKRSEVSVSKPVTLFAGDPSKLRQINVGETSMIPGKEKAELYRKFVRLGGGEAQTLWNSKVLNGRDTRKPIHTVEKEYREELHDFYRAFGKKEMKALIDARQNIDASQLFFDDNTGIAANNLSSDDTLVQAEFTSKRNVSRLDIHWKYGVPDQPVRLEIQTTSEMPEAWYSVVNDDCLWMPSAARFSGTLTEETPPGENNISTIYFPTRQARAIRLLFSGFPNEVTELRFFGP
jgi:hypothetical protein